MAITEDINKIKEITEKLENEDMSLDESVVLFNEGVELIKKSYDYLNSTKGKITILTGEVDKLKEEKFN